MRKPWSGVLFGGILAAAMFASLLAGTTTTRAQSPELPTDLLPLKFFIGKWQGTSQGQPGNGTVDREYKPMLRSRIVEVTNRSVYASQEKNPKGETHEDLGIVSSDRSAKKLRYRQYHVEGFVAHYVLDGASKEGTTVFVSESIENIPPGYRSKETYVVLGPDEFEEVFELAEPGKDYEVYSRTRLKRLK